MLDDEINFVKLNIYNSYEGWESVMNYVMGNQTGILKRPISTLSFLLSATDWPANPYNFKLTNLILHIINGLLLYLASKKILMILNHESKNLELVALLSSLIWVLHPFFVSTVLYANQIQAMLPATFILIGIILYCHGRLIMANNRTKGLLNIFSSIFIFTTLATLSKENGILLPLLILILELTVVKKSNLVQLTKFHKTFLFYIPILVIISALLYKLPDFYSFYDSRYFTMSERMLTQSRVLTTYLYHLFIPGHFTEGVYTDGFLKSTSFLEPVTTLISTFIIAFIIGFSIIIKKSLPLLSFALLFYFAAHLIESTLIPLELYFEHRNYLSAMFLPLVISGYLIKLTQTNKFFYVIPVIILGFLSFNTFKRSTLWGDDFKLITQTAEKFPESSRASIVAAGYLEAEGRDVEALRVIERTSAINDSVNLYSNNLSLKCKIYKEIKLSDLNELNRRIVEGKFLFWDIDSFTNFIKVLIRSNCVENKYDQALGLLGNIKSGKDYNRNKVRDAVGYNYALIYMHMGNFDKAYEELVELISDAENHVQVGKVFDVLDYFNGHKEYNLAIKLLDLLAPKLNNSNFNPDIYNQKNQFKYYYGQISKNLQK